MEYDEGEQHVLLEEHKAGVGEYVDCVLGRQLYPLWLLWAVRCEVLPTVRNDNTEETSC